MGIEPGSPAWKTSKITITPLQTAESYWKYNTYYKKPSLPIQIIWKHVIVETPWYTRDVNPVNHFLTEKCVTRPSIFIWLWRGLHQKSAKGRNFPFSCLCKIYIIAINGILAFCSYVIMDSQTPIFDDTIVQKPIFTQFEFFFSINC